MKYTSENFLNEWSGRITEQRMAEIDREVMNMLFAAGIIYSPNQYRDVIYVEKRLAHAGFMLNIERYASLRGDEEVKIILSKVEKTKIIHFPAVTLKES